MLTPTTVASSFCKPWRIAAAALLLLGCASPAFAKPRLVRVIWDVGQNAVYYKNYLRTEQGHDMFAVPRNAAEAGADGFMRQTVTTPVLRKGDRVRVYVVNYNPVAHVWHESSVVEHVAETPSLIGPILNAAVLAITGAGKPLTALMAEKAFAIDMTTEPSASCTELVPAKKAIDEVRAKAGELYTASGAFVREADSLHLADAVQKLAGVPTNKLIWEEFDNAEAWRKISNDASVLGFNFPERFQPLRQRLDTIQRLIDATNDALLAFDAAIATAQITAACRDDAKALVEYRDNIVTVVREAAGPDSTLRATIGTFENGSKLWSTYRRRLSREREMDTWRDEAVEIVVKDPVPADSVLRADAVFVSPEKTETERTQRSLVLGVETYFPTLLVGAGVAHNSFDFKKVQLVKAKSVAADGTAAARNQLQVVDDTSWERIAPVWMESVRLAAFPSVGLYATFGTTPDRNIFKNALAGVSVFVPRWRTAFTAGMVTARGLEEKDLRPVIHEFSDADGFALSDVSAANLPLPATRWVRSGYVGLTFTLASF